MNARDDLKFPIADKTGITEYFQWEINKLFAEVNNFAQSVKDIIGEKSPLSKLRNDLLAQVNNLDKTELGLVNFLSQSLNFLDESFKKLSKSQKPLLEPKITQLKDQLEKIKTARENLNLFVNKSIETSIEAMVSSLGYAKVHYIINKSGTDKDKKIEFNPHPVFFKKAETVYYSKIKYSPSVEDLQLTSVSLREKLLNLRKKRIERNIIDSISEIKNSKIDIKLLLKYFVAREVYAHIKEDLKYEDKNLMTLWLCLIDERTQKNFLHTEYESGSLTNELIYSGRLPFERIEAILRSNDDTLKLSRIFEINLQDIAEGNIDDITYVVKRQAQTAEFKHLASYADRFLKSNPQNYGMIGSNSAEIIINYMKAHIDKVKVLDKLIDNPDSSLEETELRELIQYANETLLHWIPRFQTGQNLQPGVGVGYSYIETSYDKKANEEKTELEKALVDGKKSDNDNKETEATAEGNNSSSMSDETLQSNLPGLSVGPSEKSKSEVPPLSQPLLSSSIQPPPPPPPHPNAPFAMQAVMGQQAVQPKPESKPSFWQRHPILKKALIGAGIVLGIVAAVAVTATVLYFTGGAAAPFIGAAVTYAVNTLGVTGAIAAVSGAGVLLTGAGAGIGAGVGAAQEKGKRKEAKVVESKLAESKSEQLSPAVNLPSSAPTIPSSAPRPIKAGTQPSTPVNTPSSSAYSQSPHILLPRNHTHGGSVPKLSSTPRSYGKNGRPK